MSALHKLQLQFLDYLLDDSQQNIVKQTESTDHSSAEQRLQYYGNAYRMRLKEVLSSDFENLHTYIGDQLFDELMEMYIDHYPSSNTSLRDYGAHMLELVTTTNPFMRWPELAEIARIELAFNQSFDVADIEVYTEIELQTLSAVNWPRFTLKFSDSVELISLEYNSFQIWRALAQGETPPEKRLESNTWLIWRQDLVSRYRSVEDPERAALDAALSGDSFSRICLTLNTYFTDQQTPVTALAYLRQWIRQEMVSSLNY